MVSTAEQRVHAGGARRRLVGALALVLAVASAVASLLVAPPDARQGESQRLMYVHVPAAWVAYGCFLVVLVTSIGYLARRRRLWDHWARAAAELGAGLTALAIALGSLWGRMTWGVWWTWDARLVTTSILLIVYVGYLGVHGLSDEPHLNARRAAVVGILGFVNVPLVHFSVVWWRTLHQPPTVLSPAADRPIDPGMGWTLLLAVLTFSALAVWVLLRRVAALAAAERSPAEPVEPLSPPVVVRGRRDRTGDIT